MPPKKQKVKVSKTSKTGEKGVNIKIVIDQSKRTKGQAPKAPARTLPAFSAMPQGSSFLGASLPARQDPAVDINTLGDKIYNNLLAEGYRREQSARGFAGFQTAGSQLNQIFDGQYRAGRNNFPIISEPINLVSDYLDEAVSDEPTTNNQILGNKLNNRGSQLHHTNENSIGALNEDDRRDNDLDNLVIQSNKSKMEASMNAQFDEDLLEEEGDEDVALQEIGTPEGQAQRNKELALEVEEAQYRGRLVAGRVKKILYDTYPLPTYPTKSTKLEDLKEYVRFINTSFGTNYESNFKGRRAPDDLRRVIRIALLKEYDDLDA